MASKIKFNPILNSDHYVEKASDYLYDQLNHGLVLKSFGQLHWVFEETEDSYEYLIEEKEFSDKADIEEYINMYESYGYDYIGREEFAYFFKKKGSGENKSISKSNPHITNTKKLTYYKVAIWLEALGFALLWKSTQDKNGDNFSLVFEGLAAFLFLVGFGVYIIFTASNIKED